MDWTRGVHRLLSFWLQQEIDREVKMFVDEETIETGDRWPEVLREALKGSRCMVSIWSPAYFRSNWCFSEWASFLEREKRLKMRSHGLIAPLVFHDGERFPRDAQIVQWTNVEKYASTARAFWDSPRVIELEDEIKKFACAVAKMVASAPPFEEDWPIIEMAAPSAGKIGLERL